MKKKIRIIKVSQQQVNKGEKQKELYGVHY